MQEANNIKDNDDTNFVYGADQPFAPRYPVFDFKNPRKYLHTHNTAIRFYFYFVVLLLLLKSD